MDLLLRQPPHTHYLISPDPIMPDQTDDLYPELGPIDPSREHTSSKYGHGDESTFFESHSEGEHRRIEEQDTHNALEQIFNSERRTTGADGDGDGDDLQLDPTLASEMAAQHHHDATIPPDQMAESSSSFEIPPSASSSSKRPRPQDQDELGSDQGSRDSRDNQTSGDGRDGRDGRGKRKATSRANMLPRGGACDFCKRRKLKCSAETPSCAVCLRSGRECVYSQKKQRSKVKMLEDRLLELERKLDQQELERKLEQQHPQASASALPSTSTLGSPLPNVNANANANAESE